MMESRTKVSMMSRAWTSMMISAFTFLRVSPPRSERTMMVKSCSWPVSLAAHSFIACLFPARTRWKTSSVSQVHHTCEPARVTIPRLVSIHLVRASLA